MIYPRKSLVMRANVILNRSKQNYVFRQDFTNGIYKVSVSVDGTEVSLNCNVCSLATFESGLHGRRRPSVDRPPVRMANGPKLGHKSEYRKADGDRGVDRWKKVRP